jgi:dihydroorotate dehydrogenase
MTSYDLIKKIMFNFEPETAHNIAEYGLRILPYCPFLYSAMKKNNFVDNEMLHQTLFAKEFINPIGLGAGFDKNGVMIDAMDSLGFGFTEIGTVTPLAQEGNHKPRLFRYVEQKSIQNSMGFNNQGAKQILKNLQKRKTYNIPVGVNIGKNKITKQEDAINDYKSLINDFKDIADYLVVNISSPNTPNLRDLQNEEFIKSLFIMAKKITSKPILLKIAPDMSIDTALSLCQTAIENKADGIIATNTTTDYSLLKDAQNFGGISGEVLKEKSYLLFEQIAKEFFQKTVLISVGGISNGEEAYRRIKAGASLVQSLTGLIFNGYSMCKDINQTIIDNLKRDGFEHISQAIGSDLK